jgi:hypothetical protein
MTKPPKWNSVQMANNARRNKGKSPWRNGHLKPPPDKREDGKR